MYEPFQESLREGQTEALTHPTTIDHTYHSPQFAGRENVAVRAPQRDTVDD